MIFIFSIEFFHVISIAFTALHLNNFFPYAIKGRRRVIAVLEEVTLLRRGVAANAEVLRNHLKPSLDAFVVKWTKKWS
jgi:hypothetical protein